MIRRIGTVSGAQIRYDMGSLQRHPYWIAWQSADGRLRTRGHQGRDLEQFAQSARKAFSATMDAQEAMAKRDRQLALGEALTNFAHPAHYTRVDGRPQDFSSPRLGPNIPLLPLHRRASQRFGASTIRHLE
jgi:hypothetical protein